MKDLHFHLTGPLHKPTKDDSTEAGTAAEARVELFGAQPHERLRIDIGGLVLFTDAGQDVDVKITVIDDHIPS